MDSLDQNFLTYMRGFASAIKESKRAYVAEQKRLSDEFRHAWFNNPTDPKLQDALDDYYTQVKHQTINSNIRTRNPNWNPGIINNCLPYLYSVKNIRQKHVKPFYMDQYYHEWTIAHFERSSKTNSTSMLKMLDVWASGEDVLVYALENQ